MSALSKNILVVKLLNTSVLTKIEDRRQRKRGTETVNTGVQAAGDRSWHTHTLRVQTHTMYAGPTQITHIKAGRITLKHHTHTHTLSLNNTFLLFL